MVTTEGMADGNASFLRAARSGNLEKVIEFLKGSIDINTSNANGLNALHLAAKEGHVNVVTELIKRGANVNAATKKGNTALHIASLAGQEEVVKVLVQLGANVNVQSQNGFTPLYMAAQENHDAVVSFLLTNGANQSLATEDGFTPLAVALQQGHDKVVAVLLENDTKGKVRLPALHIAAKKDDCKAASLLLQSDHNPDVTSKSGFTPLHIAAHYGNENIAKILLSKGADVNYAAKHQITPLHVASKWGKINMVTLLLEKGANIDASTRDGLTPLHCAARSGHDQVVDLLLEKGAPFLAKTKNGLAPLHMASQGDHVDSARILLYHKAPVDDVTVDYLTALHVAAHCGHVKVAKLLLDRKADPNARALNGFTPLHIACKKNRIKVVELLLKHGASIEATTESGLTPLHVASFMGCMNIVIYLIQNGSNPDVPTVRGETPLHLAARANQTDIIRILLRNGASVDARAREEQTPLHIAARLGNVDIVSLLLQHGAAVDAVTKDMYTPLHISAKEDQEEVAAALLDHGASLTATTKKGFTPLHLAAKYGNIKVARLLLQKGAPVDAQGKNGVTPLHVAAHYDHVNVALLLLDKGASPHAMAKNGYTPLHIAGKKNQMDIASTLLEYGANTNSESKAGFTPLHLSAQEGHADMSSLLIENKADVNHKANNGLTPLHLCAQDDRVNVAQVLVKDGAEICPQTKAGYTPLHVASHFGQINMVRFLLQNDANVHTVTSHGYTPLHQAAQQGHTLVVNLLLENQASPNVTTVQGQTPLSIAQRLGYISVVETLKVVTETTVTTTTTTVTEEKYKVVAPETMQETFMTDSEDEGGEEAMLGDQSYRYLTADEMKSLGDDSLPIDVTKDEKQQDAVLAVKQFSAPMVEEDNISPQHGTPVESGFSEKFSPDNIDLVKAPVHAGMDDAYYYLPPKGMLRSSFLVSFMVDARGGAMRGCRHSGVRVIIPPRKASMPMRITCRYLRKEKLIHPPPLMEGEACASRILEMGPVGARFLGPVIIEVPHFASTRGKEREITILRSDTGESWREHTLEASEEAVQEVLNESFEGEELSALEDLNTNRITRILTTDFPQYFAIVTRIRQEVHGVGPEGGMVSSTVVPQVQAIFPEGALTKKIRVGLQAQPIAPELVTKLLGNRVAVSPIVTVEPRRRKFHKPITLTIPVPQAATKGMINQYSGDAPTLRLLCSITGSTKSGGSSKAQWEDVTGSTPLTFVNDCVSFTTTVSARFWLMDCRQVNEVTRFATELYQEAVYVPFMSKFVIFAKRHDPFEAQLRVFCMTDDKEDKTLESQEHFTEVAKSRDVEVLEGKLQFLEFAGNLVPVTKSGEQLKFTFQAFHENRLPFTIRVKDPHAEPMGRIAFMKEPKAGRGEPPQTPICNLNVALPEITMTDSTDVLELVTLEKRYDFIQEAGLSKPELIHRADLRLSDIARELDKDWILLAQQLDVQEQDVEQIKAQTICDQSEQARMMLRVWLQKSGPKATGNELEKGLRKINREDIIKNCMFNVELVTDDVEKAVAKVHLDQSGFDVFKEELGSSREASMRRGTSLDDEQDIMKEAESAAETSSETGSLFERDHLSQALSDERDAKLRRPSKTPPPSPIDETVARGGIELEKLQEISNLLPEVMELEVQTPEKSDFRKVEVIVKENVVISSTQQEIPSKLTESETWQSGDLDTSQVSVSSLPEDDKSEPTATTVSSTAIQEITKSIVPDTEIMDVDKSGATTHIIQKTTHMTLVSHTTSDNESPEGDLQGDIPVDSKTDEESSPHSPDLSFAEKRDFFQKLSLSSSSPSATPTHTSKTNVETEIKLLPVTDNIANLEVSPEEQLSFVERVKFFENAAEKHVVQTVQTIMPEVKEIKKEVWTVSENELSEPKSSVYSDETFEKEREIETIEVIKETSCISTVSKEDVSSPLYVSKEAFETTFDTNKDAKVEVMVKKFSPGSEMFEICSVENISKPQDEHVAEVTDAIAKDIDIQREETAEKKEVREVKEKEIKHEKIATEIKQETEVPKSDDTDQPETDEEYISKTFRAVSENSYEASRSTVGAFKKGINDKLESKWQRESPDNISIVKETMEPSLGKSEIFICTEETLDNVKKILSVADAESNIVVPESEITSVETPQERAASETLDDSKAGNAVEEALEISDAIKSEVTRECKEQIKSVEDNSEIIKIIDESSTKREQSIEVSNEISSIKESIKETEIQELSKEIEFKVEHTKDDEISKKISDKIEISKELTKDSEIEEISKETKVKVEPKTDDEMTKRISDEMKFSDELAKDTKIEKISKETNVEVQYKREDEISENISYKIESSVELSKDTKIEEISKETEVKVEFKKDNEISKKMIDEIEVCKELVKDIKIEENKKITEVKLEPEEDDKISKTICDEIKINKVLNKDIEIKEIVKETEISLEHQKEDKISKAVIDKIEISKESIKDTEIKIERMEDEISKIISAEKSEEIINDTQITDLVKETEVRIEISKETQVKVESKMYDKTNEKISDETEISKELVKEVELKDFHTETEVKKEPKKDEEIEKIISEELKINEELIDDTKTKQFVEKTEIQIEPVKDDESSKNIIDEDETATKIIKDYEIEELVDKTEVNIELQKDIEISKRISDEIEISKEICGETEKDSRNVQPADVTQSIIISEQNNARPHSIIMKSSVALTSVQETSITSKEADVEDVNKVCLISKEVCPQKVETVDSRFEILQGKISPVSIGDRSDTSSPKSIEIEFVPVLEVSNDIKVAVDKTGHEALGTPCSFHKEMSIESQHSELEQSFEKRISDSEKKIPLTTFAAVEKAEYEEVEKGKKENIENIIYRESVGQKTTGKETVQSVEVTQFKKHSTEVYNVPSEKLKEKFSSKKIHIETSSEEKDSKSFIPQKLHQFLDSVTQSHDVALPSDVTPVHKRTEEWLDQSGHMMLKECAIIDNVDNGLFEDRHPTLDDEHQRRSSPTAESFDDKARVEQCDTDVMMQLLDFVSRNDIELAEVRTEDEAPDIEEDVSPSGEEEISARITFEEGKVDDKVLLPENLDEKSDDYLKVSKSDNLQLSPLRSSFDSVTSPSKKDFSSDNIETVIETKHFIEEVRHEQIHPQSSLEVEVGSHGSDDYCHLEIEREITPLSFVEEEESAKMESRHLSREEKFLKLEDIKQYAKEAATSSVVIDSVGMSSNDLNENEDMDEEIHRAEIEGVSSELQYITKSSELPQSELDAPVGSAQVIPTTGVKDSGAHVEALHPETDTVDSEEIFKITKDVFISEKDSDLKAETQCTEKSVSSFTSCAFINTAFAGADAIDEVEQVSHVRARSPYEVVRGEGEQTSDAPSEDKTSLSSSDRVTYITRHVEIRRRPLLQHIPSEISEEDLVEREIISPIHELELSDLTVESESRIVKTDTSDVSGFKTIPFETKGSEESGYTVKSVSQPVEAEDKIVKDNTSDVTVVKTVTVTKVVHAGFNERSSEYQDVASIKDRPGDIQIKSDISEILSKAKDITTPESDTGIPTSPFELVSESEMSDIEHKVSTSAISHSFPKSEKDDKSKDSVITTTLSQSVTDKTVSVSAPSSEEQKYSLNGKSESSKTEDISHVAEHSTVNVTSDDKPLTNGPGEVEYHPEYDYDEEGISKKFERVYTERSVYEAPETDEEPKCHYGSVSDDVIDSEIREILSSDQQSEDIIERPVTPEPPKDDMTDIGFVTRLKRPSDGDIEVLMREEGFAYSDDAPLSSPTSPDSKSGFAYGMHFEKYVIDEGEEAMDIDSDQFSEEKDPPYAYNLRFEHEPELEEDVPCYGDLYTHEEEDEDAIENGDKSKVLQKPGSKDSEFDILAGRKYFTKNVEIDELSMSSLQEFERLEAEIVSGRKSSVGSLDSLNGKQLISKSGDHDDVSMSSLTEFERIEKECTEGDKIDPSMQESITQLSEIEEGHESQASEASQENKSDVGREEDISIADDYNNQLENIEEIILEVGSKKTDELPFQIMMKQTQKTEHTGHSVEILSKEKQIDNKITEISKEKFTKPSIVSEITKISSWTTSKSLESSSLGDARDDLDQDSLRDELSLKPDSLIDDAKLDFQDSLHEERFDDADSLQENMDEMRDSLFEERHIEDDSLHEMDIMPDESSLSLEGSLPAIASLDSSKADEPVKLKITNLTDSKYIQPEIISGSETETYQIRQTEINISDFPRGADIMQSSTDSLEQSSSALAAFQIESESLMSSSLNSAITSGEDNTMVSSSDTIEPEGRITYRYEDIPVDDIEMLVRSGHRVIVDSEGNIQAHYEGKPCIETEEIRNTALGFHKDVTEIKLPPTTTVQVHSALTTVGYVNGKQEKEKHFHHTSGDEDYESFESSHFDPDVEVEEVQTTDEFGNTKIIRKIKKVTHTKTQFSSSSSPKNVEEQLKEFLREHTAGDKAGSAEEEIEEQKTTDEKGNVVVIRTVKRQIHTEPEVHSKTFTGPTAEQQSKKFVETFQTLDPTEDVSEYEKVDEQGNVVRVTEKFVVTPKVHTVSFSGPDAHKQMEDYMKQWTLQSQNLGEFEGDQQRAMLPSLQTCRTFEQSEISAPSDSSEHLVQTVIGDTIVTKTLSSTFPADSSEKIEIPESSTSTTTISLETVRSKSDSSEGKKSMPK